MDVDTPGLGVITAAIDLFGFILRLSSVVFRPISALSFTAAPLLAPSNPA